MPGRLLFPLEPADRPALDALFGRLFRVSVPERGGRLLFFDRPITLSLSLVHFNSLAIGAYECLKKLMIAARALVTFGSCRRTPMTSREASTVSGNLPIMMVLVSAQ